MSNQMMIENAKELARLCDTLKGGEERRFNLLFEGEAHPARVFEGWEDGPAVWVQAALHGDECDGSVAILRLMGLLKGRVKRGRVFLLPVVSRDAFEERRLSSPRDGKNLNRCGREEDQHPTWSKRYFDWLLNIISSRADILLDLHGGGYYLDVMPFAILPGESKQLCEKARDLLAGTGVRGILLSEGRGSLVEAAARRGVLSILLENGGGSFVEEKSVQTHERNVARILANAGVLAKDDGFFAAFSQTEAFEKSPAILDGALDLYFEEDGIQVWAVPCGSEVKAGDAILKTVGIQDDTQTVYRSPRDGVLLSTHRSALVKEGDYGAYIGYRKK